MQRLKNVELKQNIVKVFQIWGRLKEYGSMMATSHTDDLRLTKCILLIYLIHSLCSLHIESLMKAETFYII